MNSKQTAVAVTLIVLAGCSSAPDRPDWIDRPSADYPQSLYLTAVGQADTLETADNRALANLAKIFQVQVADRSQDFVSVQLETLDQESQTTDRQQYASRQVVTETTQLLEGARIVQHGESEQGLIQSLAVLEKEPLAKRLRERISTLDRKVQARYLYAGEAAPTVVMALTALEDAARLQQQRTELASQYQILRPGGLASGQSLGEIEQRIDQVLGTLSFQLKSEDLNLRPQIEKAVATLGSRVDPQGRYQIEAEFEKQPVEWRQGWYWQRAVLTLALVEGDDTIASQRWPMKVSAQQEGELGARLANQLSGETPAMLYTLLTSGKLDR